MYLPTTEVASLLAGRIAAIPDLNPEVIDIRAGYITRQLKRDGAEVASGRARQVMRCKYRLINIDAAERLLDAVGLALHDCPTYERLESFNADERELHSQLQRQKFKDWRAANPEKSAEQVRLMQAGAEKWRRDNIVKKN
jgi:hypothetical protein